MNTKRHWLLLAVTLLVAALFLTACKSAEPTPSPIVVAPTQAEPTAPPTETLLPKATTEKLPEEPAASPDIYAEIDPGGQSVIFWHPFTGEREAALLEIVADFNAANEWGISVVPEYQGDVTDIEGRMLVAIDNARVPDLVVAESSQAATYRLAETLVDIDDLVLNETWGLSQGEIDDYFPPLLEQGVFPSFNDARLGFPLYGVMDVLYYNADWLGELGYTAVPETAGGFTEAACAAALQPYSNATASGRWGYELNPDASRFASWSFAFGGRIFDVGTGQYHFDGSANLDAMTFLQGLVRRGCATTVQSPGVDQVDFGRGTLLFAVDSSDKIPAYRTSVLAEANFNWRVAALPHATTNPTMNVSATSVSIPITSPKSQLAAWLFLKYFTQPNVQAKWVTLTHTLPVRAGTIGYLESYFSENPAYPLTIDLLKYGAFEPSLPGYKAVRSLSQDAFIQITTGEDPAVTLAQLTADANRILDEQSALLPESPDPWAEVDPSGQTLTFWHNHTDEREAALQEIVAEFNATNKWGITVVPEYKGSYGDILLEMLPLLGTETVPNLVVAYSFHAAAYQRSGGLADLNSLVESPIWGLTPPERDDFFTGILDQDISSPLDGARLGFPPQRSTDVLFYNADLLTDLGYASPPDTPAEFQEMACAAAEQGGGFYLQLDASRLASWIFAFGGKLFDDGDNRYTYDSEAAIAALTFLQGLVEDGCAIPVTDRDAVQTTFGAGSLLFMLDSSFQIPAVTTSIQSAADFEWAVAPIPHLTAEPVQNLVGASISIPTSTPEKELAAWLFLKYFTSPEAQAKWAQASNYLPVRKSAGDFLEDYFTTYPAYQTAFDLLAYGVGEPSVPGYDVVRDEVIQALITIIQGADVAETLNSLNQTANQILVVHLER